MASTWTRFERTAVALTAFLALWCWAYSAYTIFASVPDRRVQFVPDDSYYYLTLARNFVAHGQWSFDSGVSLTTGFHPLHAYALAAIYSLTRAPAEQFVGFGILLSFIVALPAVLLAAVLAIRSGRLIAGLLLLLFLLSRNVSLNTVSAMEWSWVVSLSAFYCLAFWHLLGAHKRLAICALLLLGFIGSLARTDFGLLPAALALASVLTIRTPGGRIRAGSAFAGLVAAFLGVCVVLVHNYLATGQYLQSSARMKSLWLGTYGPSAHHIVDKGLTLFGEVSGPTIFCVSTLALGAVIFGARRFHGACFSAWSRNKTAPAPHKAPNEAVLWFGSLLAIGGYVVFYSFIPAGIQHWYTAGLVVPVLLSVSLPFIEMRLSHPAYFGVVIVILVLVARQAPMARSFPSNPEWPHQASMFRAGHYLQERAFQGRVGSWNAGIIGYYEGGHVVNLDGLVNNDIYEYAANNDLAAYVQQMRIEYIVDFLDMFSSESRRRRGGYDSPAFLRRLMPIKRFDNRSGGWRGLTLYEVRPERANIQERALPKDADRQPR